MKLPEELAMLLRQVPALSRAYLVGGCVRDSLLGIAHKEFDLEDYGVDYEPLERGLSAHGRVDLVGKCFGVIKFSGRSGGHEAGPARSQEGYLQCDRRRVCPALPGTALYMARTFRRSAAGPRHKVCPKPASSCRPRSRPLLQSACGGAGRGQCSSGCGCAGRAIRSLGPVAA